MSKKIKIILAVVISLIIVAGAAFGIYIALKDEPNGTVFGDTAEVDIIDSTTIDFSYTCPSLNQKTVFTVKDENGFVITYSENSEEHEICGKITSSEYESYQNDSIMSGILTLTVKLEKELEAGRTYHAVLKAGSVELKKEKYINDDVTSDFTVSADDDGALEATDEPYINAKAVVPFNESAEIVEEDGKYYFVFTASIDGVTEYDKTSLANYKTYAGFSFKADKSTSIRFVNTDNNLICNIDSGLVTIKSEISKDDVHSGVDYKFVVSKGFFTNSDKTVVNDSCEGTFTYVAQ